MTVRYAIRYTCKGQKENQGKGPGWWQEPGREVWVVNESEGWVPCTTTDCNGDMVPGDVKTWDTREQAIEFFMDTILRKQKHHPWYSEPDGGYFIAQVQQEFKMVPCGWRMM